MQRVAEIVALIPTSRWYSIRCWPPGAADPLADEEIIDAMREMLLPQTTLITPNAPEARRLVESDDDAQEPDLDTCARRLIELGAEYALITGTHENTQQVVINTLRGAVGALQHGRWERLPGSYHGSGYTRWPRPLPLAWPVEPGLKRPCVTPRNTLGIACAMASGGNGAVHSGSSVLGA